MRRKKILVIANTVNKRINYITGMAMMVEVFIGIAKKNFICKVCSLSPIFSPAKIGATSFVRYLEFAWILTKCFIGILFNPKSIIYMCPAPSLMGFKRDYLLFRLGKLVGSQFIFQQFTALFSNFYNSLSDKNKKRIEYMYDSASLIIVEGDFEKKQFTFIKNLDKIHIIPNGLPEYKEETTMPKNFDKNSTFHMLFLNNMIEGKGYWEVLEAVDLLVNKFKRNVFCDFVGRFYDAIDDTRYRNCKIAEKDFHIYIEEHKLQRNVCYKNCAYGKEKKELFEKSHAFLLPTYFVIEGQPTVILEALSYGCVPIVTQFRLIPEMVNKDNGIFVAPRDSEDIAAAVCYLMDNREEYTKLSIGALKDYKEKFTRNIYEEKVLEKLKDIFCPNK